jgi:hypothetical protein
MSWNRLPKRSGLARIAANGLRSALEDARDAQADLDCFQDNDVAPRDRWRTAGLRNSRTEGGGKHRQVVWRSHFHVARKERRVLRSGPPASSKLQYCS